MARIKGKKTAERIDGTASGDFVTGSDGNDTIFGLNGGDRLNGENNDDRVFGQDGDDTVSGGSGTDRISGGNGNDTLDGGTGNDKLFGLAGIDRINAGANNDTAYGGADNDTVFGDTGADKLYGDDGNDRVYGESGDDFASGGAGNDQVYGGDGEDEVYGKAGNDTLYGATGKDYLSGASGDDVIYGGTNDDTAYGGSGDDIIYGDATRDHLPGSGNDKLYGDVGNDIIYGGDGEDRLSGGSGDDKLYGQDGNDSLYGLAGKDYLSGGAGNDKIFGHDGDDTILGGTGDDSLVGGAGNDTITGGGGTDRISGGAGTDTVKFSGNASEYDYTFVDGVLHITHARGTQADGTDIILDDFQSYQFADTSLSTLNVGVHANDDMRSTPESALLQSDSVLSNDFDFQVLQGDESLTVVAVNGSQGGVGNQTTLASGALLTMNADGTFTYDPNGVFDTLGASESANDTFEYTVSDGHGHSDTASVTVRINGENDAPTVTSGAVSTINVLNLLTGLVDPTITITDPDDTQMEGARVSVTSGLQDGDQLQFTDQNGITGNYDATTGVLTLSGTASNADYETALESVIFEAGGVLGLPVGLGVRTIGFEVNDGDVFSIPSPSSTASISVV